MPLHTPVLNPRVRFKGVFVPVELSDKTGHSIIAAPDSGPQISDPGGEDRPNRVRDRRIGKDGDNYLRASGGPVITPLDFYPGSPQLKELLRVGPGPQDRREHLRQGSTVDGNFSHPAGSRGTVANFHSV